MGDEWHLATRSGSEAARPTLLPAVLPRAGTPTAVAAWARPVRLSPLRLGLLLPPIPLLVCGPRISALGKWHLAVVGVVAVIAVVVAVVVVTFSDSEAV